MAITYKGKGTTVPGTGNITPTIPTGTSIGDMMICYIGTKPWNGVNSMPTGWISLGSFADGTIAAGVGTGSMKSEIFYKIHTGSETNPLITNATNNVSTAFIISFSKDAAATWQITSLGGGAMSFGLFAPTDYEVSLANVDIIAGEVVFMGACITDDTLSVGSSIGPLSPAFANNFFINETVTALGGDMSAIGAYANVFVDKTGELPFLVGSTTQAENSGSAFGVSLREIGGSPAATIIDPFGMMGIFGI